METETDLQQRAAAWREYPTLASLTETVLCNITQREGIDFATALLFDRFQNDSQHTTFIRRIDSLRRSPRISRTKMGAKVVIVPGALYIERPDLGGDGRIVREVAESFGYETELLPIGSFGSVRNNALLIRSWLEEHSEEPIIFVSLSKGSADLKMAFMSPACLEIINIMAWINVCGPVNGSRMADWLLASRARTWFFRLKCILQKRDFQFVTDLRHDRSSILNIPFTPVSPVRIYNVIGFPLRRHMTTRLSRFCHRTLAKWGPNDGTTSLSDICHWPGEVYPVWSADHYFRGDNLGENLITALLQHLVEEPMLMAEPAH